MLCPGRRSIPLGVVHRQFQQRDQQQLRGRFVGRFRRGVAHRLRQRPAVRHHQPRRRGVAGCVHGHDRLVGHLSQGKHAVGAAVQPRDDARRDAAPQGDIPISATVPWAYNPAVVQNGKFFALPSDSRYLLIYDAGNGNLIKQIDLAELQESRDPNIPYNPDIPSTLLAVRDNLVYLAGARQVWQVPWRNMQPDKPADFTPGYWRSTDDGDQSPQVRGRAFVTADAVYLPTQLCLRRILLSTGYLDALNSSFPPTGWEETQEGPGNVIVTEDHVIVAGDRQVAVYTDIDAGSIQAGSRDRRIARRSPGAPALRRGDVRRRRAGCGRAKAGGSIPASGRIGFAAAGTGAGSGVSAMR